MAPATARRYLSGMIHYFLKLYGPRRPGSTVRMGAGEFYFSAEDDVAAVRHARTEFAEPLSQSEYATLQGAHDETVWEHGHA